MEELPKMTPEVVKALLDHYVTLRLNRDGAFAVEADETDQVARAESFVKDTDIKEIARQLIKIADDFEKSHLSKTTGYPGKLSRGGGDSSGDPGQEDESLVKSIASGVASLFSADNFKKALQSICNFDTTPTTKLALALELATELYKDNIRSEVVPETISEHFIRRT